MPKWKDVLEPKAYALPEEIERLEKALPKLEKEAPEEWLLDKDLARRRLWIEEKKVWMEDDIKECDSESMIQNAVDAMTCHREALQMLYRIPENKRKILEEDLEKQQGKIYSSFPTKFSEKCTCKVK